MANINLSEAAQAFQKTLQGYKNSWGVAGGWAIDLYLNRQTRAHEDLEIVAFRNDHENLFQQFKKMNPQKIISGEVPQFIPWQGEPIEDEVIQLRLDPIQSTDFDILLTPSENGEWICRRDEEIRLPIAQAFSMSQLGVPVLNPEIVLLFKAKYMRPHDVSDYENVSPILTPSARAWLNKSLARIHPEHPWIG